MESLLSLLMEAEAQMNEGMAGMDKRERAEIDSSGDQLTQQLSLCKASAFEPEPKLYISFPFLFFSAVFYGGVS